MKPYLLEVLENFLALAGVYSDLGPLPASLAPRTTDANKILAMQAIELIGRPHVIPDIYS